MVVFTCNHCGESLQKPRVEKHYQASTCSRNPIAVSCMDCFKDFKLEEYVAHTKCITEDERYSAKGTVHSAKKGEVKQSSWVQTVNSIIEQQQNAKPSIKRLLEMVSNYDNIPRKKVKFVNFVKSSSGGRIAPNDIEEVWSLLEAHKNAAKAETAEDGKKKRKSDEDTPETNGEDSTAPKKKKKKGQANAETSTETAAPVVDADKSSKKKNKKRKATETDSEEKVETKELGTVTNNDQPKKKKKKGKPNSEVASTEQQVNGTEEAKSEETIVCSTGNEEKQKKTKNNGGQSEEKVAVETAVKGGATKNGTAEEKSMKKKKNKNKTGAETTVTVEGTPAVNGNVESPKKKKKSKATNNENGIVENGEPTTQNGTTDTDKKSKKNKQKENGLNDTLESNDDKFCWRSIITEVLKSQPKGIKKDKLKAKVFEKYSASKGKIDNEGKLSKQYSKKIKKIGNIKLENDVFIWVE